MKQTLICDCSALGSHILQGFVHRNRKSAIIMGARTWRNWVICWSTGSHFSHVHGTLCKFCWERYSWSIYLCRKANEQLLQPVPLASNLGFPKY
jgi:hypothetical protein